jgi:hypothetical protein
MNGLERNAWFRPLDKISVPKWEWQEKTQIGNGKTLRERSLSPYLR